MPKVIKSDGVLTPRGPSKPALGERKVINRDVFSAQQQAESLRQAAEQRAAERRARGRQQAQAAYAAAHQAGSEAGLAEASAIAIDAYFRRAQQLQQAVDDCLLISRHICSKILGREPKVSEGEERRIANEALLLAVKKQRLVIGVSTRDYGSLERSEPGLLAALAEAPAFGLECIAATPNGRAALRAGDQQFLAPLEATLDTLCGLLKQPRARLQSESAVAEEAAPAAAAPEPPDAEYEDYGHLDEAAPEAEDVGGASGLDEDAATADEMADEMAEEPVAELAVEPVAEQAVELAAEPDVELAAEPEMEPAADDRSGEAALDAARRPETAGMHDISRLVAAIDAEEDE
ncbi:MAG: hypothetical protein JXR83_17525 [Deltaproteobacteria bacterium]|nr:hypothetical protein [Deltaproteobacteria bacterium]